MYWPFSTDIAKKYAQDFIDELEKGNSINDFKGMFGILVCQYNGQDEYQIDSSLEELKDGFIILKAFSGQYNSRWNYLGFVPALVNQDEYDKAVIPNDKEIHRLSQVPSKETQEEKKLRDANRIALCNQTLEKIYSLYKFTCFDFVTRDFKYLSEKIRFNSSNKNLKLLPTGTGDCAAPKLLSYAFSKRLVPISLVEFYWGQANSHFLHKTFYKPCEEKCGLILPELLGLNIVYRDDDIIVVNKPSELLAVPGRGPDKQDCIVNRVRQLFPKCITQPSVHRLDMDTSGLMVLAFTSEAQRFLSMKFEKGLVEKKYIAILDGVIGKGCNFENEYASKLSPLNDEEIQSSKTLGDNDCKMFSNVSPSQNEGTFELPFRLDIENRPHQIYDKEFGKLGITHWKKLRVWKMNNKNVTSVEFVPITGRTHQLRLASASPLGFGIPIVGDNLYGMQEEGQRLLLHSSYLSFEHPITGKQLEFSCEPDFTY